MNKTLEEKIETLTAHLPFSKLEQAAVELSTAYRSQIKPFMLNDAHRLAYLALRMPATYAAISTVLEKIPAEIHTLLDIGSGPGTAFLAAKHQFSLKEALLIEKDCEMIRLGKALDDSMNYFAADINTYRPPKSYDLITAAYSLSELDRLSPVLEALWEATNQILCIIEPGTPYGFKTIAAAREILIAKNGFIVAPCTHQNPCPWRDGPEWCHFSARFERTSLQKRIKSGALGYEDEKYSYLIVSKTSLETAMSRIVKTPNKRSGFIQFTLCDAQGIHQKSFSKRQGEAYQSVKKLDWGDVLTA